MRKLYLLVGCLWVLSLTAYSQGPYTSVAGGNWNAGATWGNGGNVEGVDFPTAGQTATIALTHAITIPAGFAATVANLTIGQSSTSSLTIAATASLTFTGTLTTGTLSRGKCFVDGILSVEEGAGFVGTQLVIDNGGTYRHNYKTTAGAIFAGTTWNAGSILEFKGYTTNTGTPTGLTQTFSNVVWNCASQGFDIALTGNAIFATVNGNFTVSNTGGNILGLSHSVDRTVNWNGNLILAAGVIFDLNSDFVNNKSTTVNLKGDLSIGSNDALAIQSSGLGTINFNGTGSPVQHVTNASSLSTPINFTITNPAILDITDGNFFSGPGNFTLTAGGTLRTGSTSGLVIGTGSGSIQVTGTRTYTAGGNIIYNGSSTQNLGDEWSASGSLSGVGVNLEIATSGGAAVNNNIVGSTSVVGNLTLTTGAINIGNSNTLVIQSNYFGNGGTITGDATSSLTFSGSGTITGPLNLTSGAQVLKNLTLSRSSSITLGTPLTISTTGTLSFTSSGHLVITGQTLTVNGNITQSSTGALIALAPFTSTNVIIGGTGALGALPFCTSGCGGNMELNNLSLGRTSGGTYTISSAIRINGTLDLASGTLTHSSGLTMVSGSTLSRSSGTTYTGASPTASGGPYNVSYVGNLTTSSEIPSNATDLSNLTIAGNVTLNSGITINGDLAITSGTFAAGNNSVTMNGANFSVNGGSFTINATSLITFSRPSATTTLGGTTIGGTQFGNITIIAGTTLSAPNATINVSGTWDNNGTFTANGGTVSFNGASQNIDPNGQAFNNVDFSGTLTKTLQGTLTVNGTLTINSTLDVGTNQTINVAGSWTNNGTFLAQGGMVNFNGAAQSINSAGQPFFDLTLAGTGTKTLTAAIDINGTLTINSGATFNVGLTPKDVNIAGNWVNNGIFTKRTGTVIFDGTSTISGSSQTNFHHVTITGALTSTSGTIDVSGNWLQSSGTFTHSSGTISFSLGGTTITPGGQTFNNVTIAAVTTKTLAGAAIINGTLTLTSGTFDTGGFALNLKGNFVSNSTSVLTASTVTFSGTTTISGGIAPTFGAITVSGILTPTSAFNVNGNLLNNGTLNAGSGTVTFGGTTAITGSSVSSFNNVMITGTLTAPSGNLNVAGAWQNDGTFNANAGTITFNGTTTASGASTTSFANIVISGSFTAAPSFNVAGNFTNNGTYSAGTGTVVFNGTSTQSISGSSAATFNNISVTNSSATPAVQVNSNQNIAGVLTLATNSVFDADGSGSSVFTMLSSADNPTIDASVAILPTGASVTGQVTVQRYMSIEGNNSGRIYRYISSPVQNAAVSQIQTFIPITGPFSGADTGCSGCGTGQSMFLYDETIITDSNNSGIADLNDGYTNFPAAANTEAFAAGRGYTIFIRANIAPISGAGSALWSLSGPINSGNVSLPVSFTSSGTLANDGWNLVGNPYPATIDWDAAGWTRSNLDNTTYMLDNGLGSPVYATHVAGGASANGGTRYIATGQAFFVKGNGGGSPTLQATEAVKASGTQTTFFRTQAIKDIMRITLMQSGKADESVIQFKTGATENFDVNSDAHKLNNPTPMFSLATISAGARYVINTLPMPTVKSEIPLDITSVAAGNYSLGFTEFDSFTNPLIAISLRDNFLGTMTDIRMNPNYEFQVTTDARSFGNARFAVVFDVAQITSIEKDAQLITIYPNPTKNILSVEVKSENDVKAQIISITGVRLYEKDLIGGPVKKGSFDLEEQADGFYILIIQDGDKNYQRRIIKKR